MRLLLLLLLTAAPASAAIAPGQIAIVRDLLRDHNIPAAESAAQALVAANPSDAEAYLLLGSVVMTKGDADATVKAYAKAAELVPTSGDYQRQLGDAYGFAAQKAGMFSMFGLAKKCRIAYEKAVELEPANVAAHDSLMTFYQQAPGMLGGGMDKAYAQAAEIKKLDATRGRIAYAMLAVGDEKYAEAFTGFEAVLKTTPDHYLALYQFGRAAALSGQRLDDGVNALKKCLALPPTPGSPGHDAANWRLGNLWEKKGDPAAARAAYQAALAINPGFQQAIDSLKKLK